MLKKIIRDLFIAFCFLAFLGVLYQGSYFFSFISKLKSRINVCYDEPIKNAVSIILTTDKYYVLPTKVAIRSMIKNKNKNSIYDIHVLAVDLAPLQIKEIEALSVENVTVRTVLQTDIYDFANGRYGGNKFKYMATNADFYKFALAEIFVKHDKSLFLDSDILVLKDLSEFFNEDIEDYYAGVVAFCHRCGFIFNNGSMVLNLKKMRQHYLFYVFWFHRLIIRKDFKGTTDRTYNDLLSSKVKFLPIFYNFPFYLPNIVRVKKVIKFYKLSNEIKSYKDILKKTVVIHYAGVGKPWAVKEDILNKKLWFGFLSEDEKESYQLKFLQLKEEQINNLKIMTE